MPLELKHATEFLVRFKWPDEEKYRLVFITRHSNHSEWIEDGMWVACLAIGSMNPWYLSSDGIWRYKIGHRYKTAEEAFEMVRRSKSFKASYELQP